MQNRDLYPQDCVWLKEPSPNGFLYNRGTPDRVRNLQTYMEERGFEDRRIKVL